MSKRLVRRRPNILLLRIMAELGRLRVRERFIPGDVEGEIVYGQQLGDLIEINPVPAIVDTVLHECLHALHPEWSEQTVSSQTTKLFHRLTEAEMKAIYGVYKSRIG